MRLLPGTATLLAALLVVSTAPAATAAPIPDTQIDAGSTPDTAKILPTEQAIFYFSAVGAPADSFECRVDGASFTTCTSPMTYQLATGSHLFEVRAKAGGDADSSPALSQWIVRNVPCEQATADYDAARSSFFKHHTRLGYTKEKLQRAKDAGNQALIQKYTRKKKKLQRQIKDDQAAMEAATAQQEAVC